MNMFMSCIKFKSFIIFLNFLLLPSVIFSHHSTSEFDRSVVTEVRGKIINMLWKNPHVMFEVETVEGDPNSIWLAEGGSISGQRRRGVTADNVKVGDIISLAGNPSTRRNNVMVLTSMLLSNGVEVPLTRNATPRWPDAGKFTPEAPPTNASTEEESDFYRVWSWGFKERGWWFFGGPENFPLTDKAISLAAQWNEYEDNLQQECIAPGMPNTMGNPYPIEFIEHENYIELKAEEFDVTRTIYLEEQNQDSILPSPLGHSIGKWVDINTLEIVTTKINYPYFNRVGVSQTTDVKTFERFTLNNSEGRLYYELIVEDSETLTEPFTWDAFWIWNSEEVRGIYDCTLYEEV
ncbi:MAG: hypothetical protein CBC38_00200 [Gammaproteobacteria bacterium TMED78]|nr:MAG: hypothetical protein CBC38_00200 [Gammaproteobacteria bacterium TMED78]|tara:strand:- start:3499 stop:4545 length:1047 start_codon:yes stop_codon:yes gene_type:complete